MPGPRAESAVALMPRLRDTPTVAELRIKARDARAKAEAMAQAADDLRFLPSDPCAICGGDLGPEATEYGTHPGCLVSVLETHAGCKGALHLLSHLGIDVPPTAANIWALLWEAYRQRGTHTHNAIRHVSYHEVLNRGRDRRETLMHHNVVRRAAKDADEAERAALAAYDKEEAERDATQAELDAMDEAIEATRAAEQLRVATPQAIADALYPRRTPLGPLTPQELAAGGVLLVPSNDGMENVLGAASDGSSLIAVRHPPTAVRPKPIKNRLSLWGRDEYLGWVEFIDTDLNKDDAHIFLPSELDGAVNGGYQWVNDRAAALLAKTGGAAALAALNAERARTDPLTAADVVAMGAELARAHEQLDPLGARIAAAQAAEQFDPLRFMSKDGIKLAQVYMDGAVSRDISVPNDSSEAPTEVTTEPTTKEAPVANDEATFAPSTTTMLTRNMKKAARNTTVKTLNKQLAELVITMSKDKFPWVNSAEGRAALENVAPLVLHQLCVRFPNMFPRESAARIAALAELASEHAMTDGMEQLLAHFMPMVQAFIAVASTALDSMPEDVKAELDAMKAPALAEPTADGEEAPKRRAKAAAAAAATATTNKTL